jgi:hypothetical protein
MRKNSNLVDFIDNFDFAAAARAGAGAGAGADATSESDFDATVQRLTGDGGDKDNSQTREAA